MQLNTRNFGEMEIDENLIFRFPEGIPGFEETKSYVVLSTEDESNPFQWLQSVDNPDLAFVIIDPKIVKPDYLVEIEDEKIISLEVTDPEKVLVYTIVVVPDEISCMTANFRAPLLINTENRLGKQVILENPSYQVKHYILEEIRKMGGQK